MIFSGDYLVQTSEKIATDILFIKLYVPTRVKMKLRIQQLPTGKDKKVFENLLFI